MQSENITRENPNWYKYALEGLHQVCKLSPGPDGPDIEQVLNLGREIFGMEVGVISEIYKDHYRIHSISSNPFGFQTNQSFELGDTICKRVIQNNETTIINELHQDPEFSKHPIHIEKKIEAYLGTPVLVRGKIFGTLSFTSLEKRQTPIDQSDLVLLELFAKSLGLMIEKSTHNSQRDFFLRKLGHEMRSPLNGILGFCEILNDEVEDPEQKEIFDIIARSSLSLEDRINDLKIFTALSNGTTLGKGTLSLKAAVKKIISDLSPFHSEIKDSIKNDLPVEEKTILSPPSFLAIMRYLLKDCLNRRRDHKEISLTWLSQSNNQTGKLIIEDSGPQPSQDVFAIFENSRYFFTYLNDERLKGLSLDLVMAKLLCDQLEINLRLIKKENGVIFSLEGIS